MVIVGGILRFHVAISGPSDTSSLPDPGVDRSRIETPNWGTMGAELTYSARKSPLAARVLPLPRRLELNRSSALMVRPGPGSPAQFRRNTQNRRRLGKSEREYEPELTQRPGERTDPLTWI